jgi:hypothetical protein
MNRAKFTSTFAKLILAAISISGVLALGTQTATAQVMTLTTPFAFSAGSQSYPAGTYQFTLLSEWSLSIRNVDGGGVKFFTVRPEENEPLGSRASLTFRDSEGHQNLEAVYVPSHRVAELLPQGTRNNRAKSDIASASTTGSSEKAAVGNQNEMGR